MEGKLVLKPKKTYLDNIDDGTPSGWVRLDSSEVYLNPSSGDLVVLGRPATDDSTHNCDLMGCGRNHVICRAERAKP